MNKLRMGIIAIFALVVSLVPALAFGATLPDPPTQVTATDQGTSGALLNWRASDTPNLKWYAIKIQGTTMTPIHTPSGTDTSFQWTQADGAYTPGTTVFQVRAVDSNGFSSWADSTWTGSGPTNQAPVVNAGPDQTVTLPNSATLQGTVSDDGLPAGSTVTSTWSEVSGPGTATFTDPSSPGTTASFSAAGVYDLQLFASDSQLSSSDDVQVTVNAPARPLLPYTSSSWLRQTISQLGLTVASTATSQMQSYINANDPHNNPNLQGLGGNGWGTSWGGVATCSDPVWKIGTGSVNSLNGFLKTTGFHASQSMVDALTYAKGQSGTDLPFEVIDTCGNSQYPNGFVVKGTQGVYAGGDTINVGGYAGAFGLTSNGLDERVNGSDSTTNFTSRGVIPASPTIRADQLQYAIDNNTDLGQRLEIFWWETDSSAGKISPPMAGFESGQAGWGAEGQVLQVNPSFVPSAQCDPGAAAIIRTLQDYGAYIGDNAGAGGTSLKMEQTTATNNPFASFDPGISQRAFDQCGLTWNDFRAVG